MRVALCNEVLAPLPFERQATLASALGYDGLEVAPFTLDDDPPMIPASRRRAISASSGGSSSKLATPCRTEWP